MTRQGLTITRLRTILANVTLLIAIAANDFSLLGTILSTMALLTTVAAFSTTTALRTVLGKVPRYKQC